MNRCNKCSTNCDQCSSSTVCQKCSIGYALSIDGKTCKLKCNDNCATCDIVNPDICLTCFSGATLNSVISKCETNLTCNTLKTCSACSPGYVIHEG